jgi:hypothetical protein
VILILIILFVILLVLRTVEFYLFYKKIAKTIVDYDWKVIDDIFEDDFTKLFDIISKNDVSWEVNDLDERPDWSGVTLFKSPKPLKVFFTLKRLTIKNIYPPETIEKLKQYNII